jgi:CheY-like chemotaxis protein
MENQAKRKVLIVDDVKSNLLVLHSILKKDYTLLMARNGLEAIERANVYLPDLILLDVLMPEMDGYAVIAALKNSSKTCNIPAIFITGLSDPGDEEKGLALGAVDYISKPFNPEIVRQRVRSHI